MGPWFSSAPASELRRRRLLLGALLSPVASAASLVDLVASARHSVLPVGSHGALQDPRFRFSGTGFVVGKGNSLVTCAHVLPEIKEASARIDLVVRIQGAGSAELEYRKLTLRRLDRSRDLALLDIEGPPLPPLTVAPDPAAECRDGTAVALIGFPIGGALGFAHVTHRGIVSSRVSHFAPPPSARGLSERSISAARQPPFEVLQLDATAYPGNSGGPLFNTETGRVIGVVSMVLVKGSRESALSAPTGISYAVPASYLLELMREP